MLFSSLSFFIGVLDNCEKNCFWYEVLPWVIGGCNTFRCFLRYTTSSNENIACGASSCLWGWSTLPCCLIFSHIQQSLQPTYLAEFSHCMHHPPNHCYLLNQGSGTYGSRARCGSFADGIWLASYFLKTFVTD